MWLNCNSIPAAELLLVLLLLLLLQLTAMRMAPEPRHSPAWQATCCPVVSQGANNLTRLCVCRTVHIIELGCAWLPSQEQDKEVSRQLA